MESMTGYGKATTINKEASMRVEIRGLNSKGMDIFIKLPFNLLFLENKIREKIQKRTIRGKIDVFINYQINSKDLIEIELSQEILEDLNKKLAPLYKKGILKEGLQLIDLLNFQEFFAIKLSKKGSRILKELLFETLEKALEKFIKERKKEGEKLKSDFIKRTKIVEQNLTKIQKLEKKHKEIIIQNFKNNILTLNPAIDQQKVETEAMIFSEKFDISEEVVRSRIHLNGLKSKIIDKSKTKGKEIDFILQEINREINTILSKTPLIEIKNFALNIKLEIEKMREQVANVV